MIARLPSPRHPATRSCCTAAGGRGVRSREHAESPRAWALDGATRLAAMRSAHPQKPRLPGAHPPTLHPRASALGHQPCIARASREPCSDTCEAPRLLDWVWCGDACGASRVLTRASGGRGAGPLPATVSSARYRSAPLPNIVAPSSAGSGSRVSVLREGAPPPGPHSRCHNRVASQAPSGAPREASGGATRGRSRGRP
jgi:hypothetical protein